MTLKKALFVGLFLLTLTACGLQHSNPGISSVQVVHHWSPSEVRINCPSGDCPQGIGAVVFLRRHGHLADLVRCTATMISRDAILTNSHCDKEFKPDEGYFFVNEGGKTRHVLLGEKLFDVRDGEGIELGMGPDLAIHSLRKPILSLRPRSVSRRLAASMNFLIGYMVNSYRSHEDALDLFLKREVCATTGHQDGFFGGLEDLAVGLALFNCPIVKGNSGSPLFLPGDFDHIQVVANSYYQTRNRLNSLLLETFGMGNRIQCMDLLPQLGDPDPRCARRHASGLILPRADAASTTAESRTSGGLRGRIRLGRLRAKLGLHR